MSVDENTLISSVQVNQSFETKKILKSIVKDIEKVSAKQVADNTAIDARVTSVEDFEDTDYTKEFLLGGM